MKSYSMNENYIASEGQQVFQSEKPFINATLAVFLNGNLQTYGEDKDYVTVQDTGRVIFNNPLSAGDAVAMISTVATERISMEIVSPGRSDKPTTLFRKYGTAQRFKSNNKYTINLMIDKEPVTWSFISHLNPMFTTSRKVWEDIGEFIEGFTEEYINSKIFQNSIDVIELIDELATQDNPIENVTYSTDHKTGDYIADNKAIKNWVRYKTEIDLVYARYYGISYRYGSVRKEVGDISIEKSTKLPYIDQLLGRLKDYFDEADKAIRGLNTVASAVKAINDYKYDNWARETNF